MVWWGFGALKTPRRASSLPTLQRRPADRRRVTVHWTNTGQRLDVYWTPRLQPDCTSTAPRLHLCCTCAAQGLPTRARHRRSGEKNDLAGVAHVAREFASIARNRSKTAFEREIGSPGSRRRDAKCSVHISASPEIASREIASSCSAASSRSRASSSIASAHVAHMTAQHVDAAINALTRYRGHLSGLSCSTAVALRLRPLPR